MKRAVRGSPPISSSRESTPEHLPLSRSHTSPSHTQTASPSRTRILSPSHTQILSPSHAQVVTHELSKEIDTLESKWATTCHTVKRQYSKLASALNRAKHRGSSPFSPSSASAPHSRHSTPDIEAKNDVGLSLGPVGSLDNILDSLKEEAEKKAQEMEVELKALSAATEDPPPLPKHSIPKPSLLLKSITAEGTITEVALSGGNRSSVHHSPKTCVSTHENSPFFSPRSSFSGCKFSSSPPPTPPRTPSRTPPRTPIMRSATTNDIFEMGHCRLAVKLKDMKSQIDSAKLTIKDAGCDLRSSVIESRLEKLRVLK